MNLYNNIKFYRKELTICHFASAFQYDKIVGEPLSNVVNVYIFETGTIYID